MPEQLPHIEIPGREHATWRDWAALVIAIGLALGIWHVDHVAAGAQAAADQATTAAQINRDVSYRNREVICDFIRSLHHGQPPGCLDPALEQYRKAALSVALKPPAPPCRR